MSSQKSTNSTGLFDFATPNPEEFSGVNDKKMLFILKLEASAQLALTELEKIKHIAEADRLAHQQQVKFATKKAQIKSHLIKIRLKQKQCVLNPNARNGAREGSKKHNKIKKIQSNCKRDSIKEKPSNVFTIKQDKIRILFQILPVKLYGPTGIKIDTYAFLDEGSAVTLLEDSIARKLGFNGETKKLPLKWTGDTTKTELKSQRLDLYISGSASWDIKYLMKSVYTVNDLNLPTQTFDVEQMKLQYPHLRGADIENLYNVVPQILIGVDQPKLMVPLAIKEDKDVDVVAVKTRIGWVAYGVRNALFCYGKKYNWEGCNTKTGMM